MKIQALDYNKNAIEIEIKDGKIHSITSIPFSKDLKLVIPGFIEMHAHGGYGFDFMDTDLEACKKYLNKIALLEGTTSVLGTTITSSTEKTAKAINTHKALIGKHINGANLVGIHLEGPFINPLKKGAHPVEYMKPLTLENLKPFVGNDFSILKKITYAPELTDTQATIDIVSKKILASAGHSVITVDNLKQHMKCGLNCITHFNNAMPKYQEKENSLSNFVLDNKELYIEYIADGIHNPIEIGKLVHKRKDKHKVTLITDSLHVKGLQDGTYPGPNWDITKRDGAAWTPNGILNGSVYTLIEAFKDWIKIYGATIEEAVLATSTNAAEALRLNKGKIKVGYDADLLLLDDDFNIVNVYVNGNKINKE